MSNQTRKSLAGVLCGFSVVLFLAVPIQGQVAVPAEAPADISQPISPIRPSTTAAPKSALAPVDLSKLTDGVSQREGWALAFNGRGDHVTAPYLPFHEYKAFTVEAWVRGWKLGILCQGRAGDPENSIWLSLGTNAGQPHETCGWEYGAGKNHQVAIGKADRIEWNHVALVYDGTRQYVFLNGKLKQSRPATKPGPFNKSRKLILGAHEYDTLNYGSGLLGSVRISKVARYRAKFSPSRKLSTDANTVLLYDMAQGKGTRLQDASGHKHDGTITGARWLKANEIFSLDLSDTQVTDAGLKHLKGLSTLEVLRLDNTRISDSGMVHLKDLRNLRELVLNRTRITDTGLEHLKRLTKLELLWLFRTQVSDAGLIHLRDLKNLELLHLLETKVTDAGLMHLKDLRNLRELQLNRCRITDAGLLHLKGLTKLERLWLYGTQVSDAGLVHLGGLKKLETLHLHGTKVTGAGLKDLNGLANLKTLWLGSSQVTAAGFKYLKDLTSLQEFRVYSSRVTDSELEHLKKLTKLKTLYLTNNRVTTAGMSQLRRALRQTRIISSRSAVTTRRTSGTTQPSSSTAKLSVEELLKQIDSARENTARSKKQKKPAGSAKSERTLHVIFNTPYLGSYYDSSAAGGVRYSRFLASELVFVNNTNKPIIITRDQILLKSDDQTMKLQDIPSRVRNQSFRIKTKYLQLRNLKLLKTLTVPAGKSASGWIAFTGIPQGSTVPRFVLEMNTAGKRTELNINDYALGMMELNVERIGPRGALGLLTIAGELNTVSLGSLISAFDQLAADNVVRAVVRWTDSAEEVESQLLTWMKQGAALSGSGNSINNPQTPLIAPASIHELHLAQIPKSKSSSRSTSRSYIRDPYGRSIPINIESRVHKTDIDAVSAALVSAYRNLPADEVIREIETGHPLTRAAAIAGGGARLPVEHLPVLLKYADHKDPRLQKAALAALGHFGQKQAIEKLIAFAKSSDADLARVATESLASSRYSAAHHALLEVLKSEKSPSKKVIITALARFPRSLWSETIYEIAIEFNPDTSVEALRALARIGHPKLIPLFEKAIHHPNTKIHDEAFKLLLTRTDPQSERMALEFTLNHLEKSPPTSQMSTLLTRTKDSRAVPMLLKHFRELKGNNSTVTNLLAQIGDQTVAGVFVEMYPQLKSSSSKTTVLNALQQLRSPEYRKLADEALYDKSTSLVSTACRTLQGDGSPEAMGMLVEAFEKVENKSTWKYIANALGTIATPEAREALQKARSSKSTWKHTTVLNAIRNLQRRSPGYQYFYQGQNYAKQKKWDQAVNYFSLAIRMDPQLSEAYSGRGLAYITKGGKGTEARVDFAKAEKLDPYNAKAVAYSALMMADVAKGKQYREAIKKSEQARKRFIKDNDFAFQTARLYGKAAKWAIKDEKLSAVDRKKMAESYKKKSMQELQRAFKLGFKSTDWANTTPDFDPIKNLPEFKKLVKPTKPKPKGSSKKKSTQKKAVPAVINLKR